MCNNILTVPLSSHKLHTYSSLAAINLEKSHFCVSTFITSIKKMWTCNTSFFRTVFKQIFRNPKAMVWQYYMYYRCKLGVEASSITNRIQVKVRKDIPRLLYTGLQQNSFFTIIQFFLTQSITKQALQLEVMFTL